MPTKIALGQTIANALGFEFSSAQVEGAITKIEFTLELDKPVIVRVTGHIDQGEAEKFAEKVRKYALIEQE